MKIKTGFGKTMIGLATLAAFAANAEQRALLVGVGEYRDPKHNLPGIDLDIQTMEDTLHVMGFAPSQIRTLVHKEATAGNVEKAIAGWLTDGVGPEDRVVFYFSGHGSYVPDYDGDEPDGVDEVLVTHDVRQRTRRGKSTLTGVVLDDELNRLFSAIPSKNIMTIVDACHSGTSTRAFTSGNRSVSSAPMHAKTFVYPGMPVPDRTVATRSVGEAANYNYVSISAANDDELAIGTDKGGMFTLGLSGAIIEAAKSSSSINVATVRDRAAEYIAARLDPSRVHHPQVTGNPDLAGGSLRLIPLAEGNGPNRKRIEELVAAQGGSFNLGATQSIYAVDDPVELRIDIPADGYLNVVTVDSQDNATVLFPNQYHLDNSVGKGQFAIPTEQMGFELPAAEPLGPTLVAAFVTLDRVSFYEQTLDGRDADGNIDVEFASLSSAATRAIKVVKRKKRAYGALLELSVVQR